MANYKIINGELYNIDDELYHYGIPGMKWGHKKSRLESKVERKYAKAGEAAGKANYYRDAGASAVKRHEAIASIFDKQAKKSSSQGDIWRAEAAKRSAAAIRARGANVKSKRDATADKYFKKATKSNEKASSFATKKRVDLGKKRLNDILKENTKKGYERAKETEKRAKEQKQKEFLGEIGYSAYKQVKGE